VSWSERDVPDLTGKVFVVTGASAGLGLENTRALAAAGARVVMATRNVAKTEGAAAKVRRAVPGAVLEQVMLNLADLSSVADAAAVIRDRHDRIDAALCNAGLMATPLQRTADGFEMQLGVNHLGHAAFVARLLPAVRAAEHGRIVVTTSELYRLGRIRFDDLNWRRRYQRWLAYGQSKLANLLYVHELQRRLDLAATAVTAAAAHPGYAGTELQHKGPTAQGGVSGAVNRVAMSVGNTLVSQSPAQGALPQLYAATAPGVPGDSYWGPSRLGGLSGPPGPASRSRAARDDDDARRLWDLTEELTGVSHDLAT
jgi:NAD(P)-dependent dehydrogenase (short-subunit alcohol dehydrogenase family)